MSLAFVFLGGWGCATTLTGSFMLVIVFVGVCSDIICEWMNDCVVL